MRNAGLDEAQTGIKTAGRNINNLIYTDDTTLMAESKEDLKSLLVKAQEENGEVGLKLNIQKRGTRGPGLCPAPLTEHQGVPSLCWAQYGSVSPLWSREAD